MQYFYLVTLCESLKLPRVQSFHQLLYPPHGSLSNCDQGLQSDGDRHRAHHGLQGDLHHCDHGLHGDQHHNDQDLHGDHDHVVYDYHVGVRSLIL